MASKMSGPTRRHLMGGLTAALVAGVDAAPRALAAAATPLTIGVMSDMSGVTADYSGPGTVASIAMAIEDFSGVVHGRRIELLKADHLNKPDVGLQVARKWYDDGVSAIFDVGLTSVALAVQTLTRERNRVVVFTSSASAELTGSACSPNGIHWTYNSQSVALGTVRTLSAEGARTWFFLTVDYAYGKTVQRDTTALIEANGGRVVGSRLHAFDTTDFASSLLEAQASRADVIALATTGGHSMAMVKQADEFGLRASGQKIAPLGFSLHDIRAVGLQAAQGLIETTPFYWDQTDATRAFSARFFQRFGRMPNMVQAGAYGAVTHYLKSVQATGTDDAATVLTMMKATPINDFMTRDGRIRADGRVIRDLYVLRVKTPAQSTSEWDVQQVIGTIPGSEAFPAPSPPTCSLMKA